MTRLAALLGTAATLLATLPVAVLFAWLQRYLIGGLAGGAVK